jgi:hypothetical protein
MSYSQTDRTLLAVFARQENGRLRQENGRLREGSVLVCSSRVEGINF